MPAKELKKQIIQFLKKTNMCIIATCSNWASRATLIEYHSKRTYVFRRRTRQKLKNIVNNLRVSIEFSSCARGWDGAKDAQITGKTKIILRGSLTNSKKIWTHINWKKPQDKWA